MIEQLKLKAKEIILMCDNIIALNNSSEVLWRGKL